MVFYWTSCRKEGRKKGHFLRISNNGIKLAFKKRAKGAENHAPGKVHFQKCSGR